METEQKQLTESEMIRENIRKRAEDAAKNYCTFDRMVGEAERRNRVKHDYTLHADRLSAMVGMGKVFLGLDMEGLKGNMQTNLAGEKVDCQAYELTKTAHTQLAKMVGIPIQYYNKLKEDRPKLLADNINAALIMRDDELFIRELDNTIRAVLPATYNVMDDARLLPLIQKKVVQLKAEITRCWMNETASYVMAQLPTDISREVSVGDTMSIGVIISNSEVGMAPLEVLPQVMRLVCSNGLIIGEAQGGYSNPHKSKNRKTAHFDNELQWATIETLIDTSMSPKVFDKIMEALKQAQATEVRMDEKEIRKLCINHGLNGDIATEIITVMKDSSKQNVWELINVITAIAKERSMDERVAMENKAYNLMASLSKPVNLSTETMEDLIEDEEDDKENEANIEEREGRELF